MRRADEGGMIVMSHVCALNGRRYSNIVISLD